MPRSKTPPPIRAPKTALLRLGRQSWPPGKTFHEQWRQKRVMENAELWFIWAGGGTVKSHDQTHPLHGGTAVFFQRGGEYEISQEPNNPISVNFFSFHLPSSAKVLSDLPTCLDHVDFGFYESVSRRTLELYWEAYVTHGWKPGKGTPKPRFSQEEEYVRTGAFCPNPIVLTTPTHAAKDPSIQLANRLFEALFHDFLARARNRSSGKVYLGLERKHRDIMMEIAARLRRKPELMWSVASLARESGYSTDHFARIFHRVVGIPPKLYLMNCRVAEAKRLLVESNLTIKEISARLGYNSAYFFSRQFKEITGTSPSDYREPCG